MRSGIGKLISATYGCFAVLSDPAKRLEYDISGSYEINRYTLRVRINYILVIGDTRTFVPFLIIAFPVIQEYLTRFKGMILTCNGLGINQSSIW